MAGKKLIIVGTGETGRLAYEYFTHDSNFEVIAFAGDREFINDKEILTLPVLSLDDIKDRFPPEQHHAFVAVSSKKLNSIRSRLLAVVKNQGYVIASYVSSRSFLSPSAKIGENCFIMDNSTIQYNARIGNNVTVWSGSYIGHSSIVKDNVYISPGVSVAGHCTIGENCFLGIGSSLNDNISIERNVVTGNGSVVVDNLKEGKVYAGNPAKVLNTNSSFTLFGISEN